MRPWPLLLILLFLGCGMQSPPSPTPGSPSPTPTGDAVGGASPTPTATPTQAPEQDPIDALVAALAGTGVEARRGDQFMADPLSRRGVVVCVAREAAQVYLFDTPDEAAARAATINPRDPSQVGTSIIEWAGSPKFWLGDRLIVLYLGTEQSAIDALVGVLGQPFAVGQGRPPLLGGDGC